MWTVLIFDGHPWGVKVPKKKKKEKRPWDEAISTYKVERLSAMALHTRLVQHLTLAVDKVECKLVDGLSNGNDATTPGTIEILYRGSLNAGESGGTLIHVSSIQVIHQGRVKNRGPASRSQLRYLLPHKAGALRRLLGSKAVAKQLASSADDGGGLGNSGGFRGIFVGVRST